MTPFVLSFMAGFAVILFIFGIRYAGNNRSKRFAQRVAPVVKPKGGLINADNQEESLWVRYNNAWTKVGYGAGQSDTIAPRLGIIMIGVALVTMLLIFALTQIAVLALFVGLVPVGFGWLMLSNKAAKRSVQIEKQMSSFVTSIYMYIQSGLQPVTAIVQAVDATPDPLKSELVPLVISLKNNENERVAFRKLRDRTSNPELKELCSNISIALAEGSDIGKQLMNLSETVRVKGELRGEIQNELQDPRMTAVIGFLSFFFFFAISWFSQEDAQEVWGTLMGTIILTGASIAAGAGGFWAYRIIKKAQDLA
jgi:Flp pilus assembly protein TadB